MLSAQIPSELREALEECANGTPVSELRTAAHSISQTYREGRQPVFRTAAERLAYAVTRMPATYGAICAVLREIDEPVESVLDLGAGTGAGAWAARESLAPAGDVILLELNPDLMELGQKLGAPATLWRSGNMLNLSGLAQANVVLMSYSLGELGDRDRERVLDSAWDVAGKYVAVVEPGTPTGYRTTLKVREQLIAKGGWIAAPCPHSSACPMDKGDWCHFAVRVARTKLHKLLKGGDLGYEDEKFSYVLAAKPNLASAAQTQARVLRHPTVQPGLISLTLCGPQDIRQIEARSRDKAAFKAARKASWGSRWAFPK